MSDESISGVSATVMGRVIEERKCGVTDTIPYTVPD